MIINDAAHELGTTANYLLVMIGCRHAVNAGIERGVHGIVAFAQQNGWTIITGDTGATERFVIEVCNWAGVPVIVCGTEAAPMVAGASGAYVQITEAGLWQFDDRDQVMIGLGQRVIGLWDGKEQSIYDLIAYAQVRNLTADLALWTDEN